jgi:hypothetical protein
MRTPLLFVFLGPAIVLAQPARIPPRQMEHLGHGMKPAPRPNIVTQRK